MDPTAFNAVPSDDKDDFAALQSAYDAAKAIGQPLCLLGGRYEITRRQLAGVGNIGSWQLSGGGPTFETSCTDIDGQPLVGMEVAGIGMAKTIISMRGSALFPGSGPDPDWHLIEASNIDGLCFRDVSIVADRKGDISEQTHLFVAKGPASNVTLERIETWLPRRDGEDDEGGDCVRSLGTDPAPVENFSIRQAVLGPCYRTALIWQRGTHGALLEDSWLRVERNNQTFDMEASTGGSVRDLIIRRTQFVREQGQLPGYTVAFDGVGDGLNPSFPDNLPITNVLFEDVVIEGGGLLLDDVKDVMFRRVKINSDQAQQPTLHFTKSATNVLFYDSHIIRPATGDLMKGVEQEGRVPVSVRFLFSSLTVTAAAGISNNEGMLSLSIDYSTLTYAGPAATSPMVKLRGNSALGDPDYVRISNSVIVPGAMDQLVEFVISAGGTGGFADIKGNTILGVSGAWPLFSSSGTSGTPVTFNNTFIP